MRLTAVLLVALFLLAPAAPATPVIEDDAGSGRDAPNTPADGARIASGGTYDGWLTGFPIDTSDHYAFPAQAGDVLEAHVLGSLGCLTFFDPTGAEVDFTCVVAGVELGSLTVVADMDGVWFLEYAYLQPQAYRFSLGINEPAPTLLPVGLSFGSASADLPPVTPSSQSGEHVVIAVVDTGINPYHEFFRAPGLVDHPSTWLSGFPSTATSVPLTLDAASYDAAFEADAAAWDSVRRSTYFDSTDSFVTNLYTFPGTRVVAGLSFSEYGGALSTPGVVPILDEHGHGTHSAGLAAGANLPEAAGNVLVVMIETGGGDFTTGVRWAARQPWIDAISLSAGTIANAPVTFSPLGDKSGAEWASLEAAKAGKPIFIASGNGFSNTGLTPDHCTTYTSEFVGPAWVTRIGAADRGSGNPTWWHCVPVEAIARTNVASPDAGSLTAAGRAGGTSAATPNAAGHFADLYLKARAAGLNVTAKDVLQHLLQASEPAPTRAGFGFEPSLAATAPLDQGYGLVDAGARDRAWDRLVADLGPTPRPELEAWFEADAQLRHALWGPGSATDEPDLSAVPDLPPLPPLPVPVPEVEPWVPGNDGWSGRDAGEDADTAVPVAPKTVYQGSSFWPLESSDWFSFEAVEGQEIKLSFDGPLGCVSFISPSGNDIFDGCAYNGLIKYTGGAGLPVTETGTWHMDIGFLSPGFYKFAYTLDGSQPPPVKATVQLFVPTLPPLP